MAAYRPAAAGPSAQNIPARLSQDIMLVFLLQAAVAETGGAPVPGLVEALLSVTVAEECLPLTVLRRLHSGTRLIW